MTTPLMRPPEYQRLAATLGRPRALAHALTRWDRREADLAARNPRRYHNPHALGIYLQRAEEVAAGAALADCFEDQLLTYLEGLAA